MCLVPFQENCFPFPGCQTEGAVAWNFLLCGHRCRSCSESHLTSPFPHGSGSAHTVRDTTVSVLHFSSALDCSLGMIHEHVGHKCFCNIGGEACGHFLPCPVSTQPRMHLFCSLSILNSCPLVGRGPVRESPSPQQPPGQDEGLHSCPRLYGNASASGWHWGRGSGL